MGQPNHVHPRSRAIMRCPSDSREWERPLARHRGLLEMPTPYPSDLLTAFRAMAEIVYSGESYDSVHEAVCLSAVSLVDGCDHASLMLRRGGRVETVAASSDVARRIDELEKALGEGPCLDAIDDNEPDQHICSDLTEGSKWPKLARMIMVETGVRGMAGFRLRQEGQRVG